MQRLSAIAILITGVFISLAAVTPSVSQQPPVSAPLTVQPSGPSTPTGPNGEGLLLNSMGWDKIQKKTGVIAQYYIELGISTNNTIEKGDPSTGNAAQPEDANGPVAWPSDADELTLEQVEQFLHRNDKSNIISGITPTPAPMLKKFDWGFLSDTVYGRSSKGCLMTGFDKDWAMNANAANDTNNRYQYLCQPNAYFDLYFPVLKGVTLQLGRMDDLVVIDEVPPAAQWSPNVFYSKSYDFYRDMTVLGGRLDANIFHNQRMGYLMGEFGVNNGNKTVYSMNGNLNYVYALRYRSPKMGTWLDYSGRVGDGNVKVNAGCSVGAGCTTPIKPLWVNDNLGNYHLFSPRSQKMFENALRIEKEFLPRWKITAQVQFGKQFGDGEADTIATYTPAVFSATSNALALNICNLPQPAATPYCRAGFTGASFLSYEGMATYTFRPQKLTAALRLEQFRNPNGYFGQPAFAAVDNTYGAAAGMPPNWGGVKGAFNEVTGGVNYNPTRYIRIRPEIRYDWQTGNYVANAFGQNNPNGVTSSSQVTTANHDRGAPRMRVLVRGKGNAGECSPSGLR